MGEVKRDPALFSPGERVEMIALGVMGEDGGARGCPYQKRPTDASFSSKREIQAPQVLNEAQSYGSSFPRGLRLDIGAVTVLLLSGTASVDESGQSVHVGDFAAQCWRTYRNITALLASESATWHDVVRTVCYLSDIERDYATFNRVRTRFFEWLGLETLPASVSVQAQMCRRELLIEIETAAVIPRERR